MHRTVPSIFHVLIHFIFTITLPSLVELSVYISEAHRIRVPVHSHQLACNKNTNPGNFLAVLWLGLRACTAVGPRFNPWGTKTLQVAWCGQKQKQKKNTNPGRKIQFQPKPHVLFSPNLSNLSKNLNRR